MCFLLDSFSESISTVTCTCQKTSQPSAMEQTPFACDMTAMNAEGHATYQKLRQEIFRAVQEVSGLPDGYALRLPSDPPMIARVAEFAGKERLCCPFFSFGIEIESGHGPLWLRITGRSGARDFMREEFGIDALIKSIQP